MLTLSVIFNWSLDGWIIAAGALCAMSCALLGNFLVLRRMSMMGDAISHAVLPGLAIAFLVTGSRSSWPMFIGAAAVGVLTALFTQWIHSVGKVEESASMGVVFTTLFAIGLIILRRAADAIDLDPGCVLHGLLEFVPLDTRSVGGFEIPRVVIVLAIVFIVDVLFVLLFYKELKISSFDPELATTLGLNSTVMHYLLMTLVAVTTVASFESVGSILVVAMLIVPAATAHLLTDRLPSMILVSVIVAILSAVLGHVAALTVPTWFGFSDTNTAGMMAVVAGGILFLAMIASPRHGAISKLANQFLLTLRIAREDLLGLLYRLEEMHAEGHSSAAPRLLHEARGVSRTMSLLATRDLLRRREIESVNGGYRLAPSGRQRAKELVRSHRLWEEYLRKHLNLAVDHVHAPAERLEHITSDAMRDRLSDLTDQPAIDPQGKPIPPK